jgi:hypothetical protein
MQKAMALLLVVCTLLCAAVVESRTDASLLVAMQATDAAQERALAEIMSPPAILSPAFIKS